MFSFTACCLSRKLEKQKDIPSNLKLEGGENSEGEAWRKKTAPQSKCLCIECPYHCHRLFFFLKVNIPSHVLNQPPIGASHLLVSAMYSF